MPSCCHAKIKNKDGPAGVPPPSRDLDTSPGKTRRQIVNEILHDTTALQIFREARTEAVISENWLLAAALEAAWQQAVDEVPG